MSAPTTAKRPVQVTRPDLLEALAPLLDLVGTGPEDVAYLHVSSSRVTVKCRVRGRTGKLVPGTWVTRQHDILPEPLED